MSRPGVLHIDLENILYGLFCVYAFTIPYELVFEYWLNIDTIFKPFRIISLLIIGVYAIKSVRQGIKYLPEERIDYWLYGMVAYGICISMFRMISAPFNMTYFYGDIIQMGLHLMTFFVFKNTVLTVEQGKSIFRIFLYALTLNVFQMLYTFNVLGNVERQSGFMENPNYVALGIVACLGFIGLHTQNVKKLKKKVIGLLLVLLFLYALTITGSRAGLVLLILTILLIFYFSNSFKKIVIGASVIILGVYFYTIDLFTARIAGSPNILANRVSQGFLETEESVRSVIWEGAINSLEETGYVGMGIGQFKANFSYFFQDENNLLISKIVNYGYHLSMHNDYLAVLTDYGFPGLVLFLVFYGLYLLKKWKTSLGNTVSGYNNKFEQFQFIVILGLMVYGMTADNFLHQLYWFLLMMATKHFQGVNDRI